MAETELLKSIQVGKYVLKNRVIMAPLTRCRASEDHIPTPMMIKHYEQRSSAGLIITEATFISDQSIGYMNTPGIYNQKQIDSWRKVTDAVHENDGKIFIQLWHTGRVAHSSMQPKGNVGVAPSSIAVTGTINSPGGYQVNEVPEALRKEGIQNVIDDFARASENAMDAGFDGVEIHGANGYLIDQFINESSNQRKDEYGGSIENRCRFALEVTQAVCEKVGNHRTGIRLSPSGTVKDMYSSNSVETFAHLIQKLNRFNLAYLHIMEPYRPLEPIEKYKHYLQEGQVTPFYRKIYQGNLISNVGFTFESGNKLIRDGHADMVSFGKLFISNPDLVYRFKQNLTLNPWDKSTFYQGGEKGYNDYTVLRPECEF